MSKASHDPIPLSKIAIIDEEAIKVIEEKIEIPSATWGRIAGTLSAQTDLNSALSGKEPANANIQAHVISNHAPSNAVSLAIVKADLDIADAISKKHSSTNDLSAEQKTALTGGNETNLHTHAGGSGGLTQAQILTRQL